MGRRSVGDRPDLEEYSFAECAYGPFARVISDIVKRKHIRMPATVRDVDLASGLRAGWLIHVLSLASQTSRWAMRDRSALGYV